ncbi:MAG TPA: 3-mercaptopyruvate sulfurtransferase [Rhizomicrobium sp.]|jgi:thiosulfate/3-mercaptopyruvate sulfurtransferase
MMNRSSPLVSTEWLAEHLSAPDIRVADASWYLPQTGRNAKSEYLSAHIPGAVFFDIDDLSDEASNLPHMLAPPAKFASRMRQLGLGDGNLIVVYDGAGIYSSARAWWMLRAMGHEDVAVLDGGFPKWKREGRPIQDIVPQPPSRHFTPRPNTALLRDFSQILQNLETRREQVVDLRGAGRFAGKEAEPRPGVRPGHIPGSTNLPYTELSDEAGILKSADALRDIFAARGIDPGKPIVTSCGSGVTAAIGMLALIVGGARDVSLYDGSWSEWGARPEVPVATG